MTSIQDAWGVSDLSMDTTNPFQNPQEQAKHLQSHVIPKSSVLNHPNSIVETRPTRIDVALYHPVVINHLFSKTPEMRTALVTNLVQASLDPPKPALVPAAAPSEPISNKKEYFHYSSSTPTSCGAGSDMSVWILLTFLLLLVEKLVSIWKNS